MLLVRNRRLREKEVKVEETLPTSNEKEVKEVEKSTEEKPVKKIRKKGA